MPFHKLTTFSFSITMMSLNRLNWDFYSQLSSLPISLESNSLTHFQMFQNILLRLSGVYVCSITSYFPRKFEP